MSGLEGLGIAASVITVADLSLKVISSCSKYAQDVKSSKDDRARLLQSVTALYLESDKVRDLLSTKGFKLRASRQLYNEIGSSEVQLRELEKQLSQSRSSLKWPLRKDKLESAIYCIEKSTKTMVDMLQIDMADLLVTIDDRAEAEKQRATVDQLPYVGDAVWDSHAEERNATCLPNTRETLLKELKSWIKDTTQQSKTVFWLNGMAGTGKSTISRTLSEHLSQDGQLGATFFFKRGEVDRGGISKMVPTIARQLAINQPELRPDIQAAIQGDPTVTSKSVAKQFNTLILDPLRKSSDKFSSERFVTIVIDALDECESEPDIRLIVSLFSTTKTILCPRPRVLITSRPDLPVRLGFRDVKGFYQDLILHDISAAIIKQDISTFFYHKMKLIRDDWNASVEAKRKLPQDWPGSECIRSLTNKAVPLFIFAATACRFISERQLGSPEKQLHRFLEYQIEGTAAHLDFTYRPVLAQLFSSNCSKIIEREVIHEFQRVIGTIINLFDPLSASSLSRLLDVDQDIIDSKLDLLHSVLDVPPSSNAPIRMLHLSFRDYLMSPVAKKRQFWIDEKKSAGNIAKDCLRVMQTLQPDICRLRNPGTHRSALKPEFLNACMPPEVQYACLYWVNHQIVAGLGPGDASRILTFLKQHLLHWFEAMSLLGKAFQITKLMRELQSVMCVEHTGDITELVDFIDDAIRFVDIEIQVLNSAPLQIYCSFLVLAPSDSIVRQTFAASIPPWVTLLSGQVANWDSRLRVLANINDPPKCPLTYSPDSKLLCFISEKGHLHVWSCDTGECIHDIEPEPESSPSVTKQKSQKVPQYVLKFSELKISPNGKLVAVILERKPDQSLQRMLIFDLTTGQVLSKVHDLGSPCDIAFSQDSKFIWSCTLDAKVCVWDLSTGTCVDELDCPVNTENSASISFSSGGPKAVIIQDDTSAYVWYLNTSNVNGDLNLQWTKRFDHQGRNISPDGRLFAVPSTDGLSLVIWDILRRKLLWKFSIEQDSMRLMLFSTDSTFLTMGVKHGPIQLWDMRDGKCLKTLTLAGETRLQSITFPPDTKYLISTHATGHQFKMWLWEINTGTCTMIDINIELSSLDKAFLVSPDGKTIAWKTFNRTVELWDWQGLLGVPPKAVMEIESLFFSPDSSMIASLFRNGEIIIRDTATGATLYKFSCPHATSVEFSPDSSLVATTRSKETVKVWDLHEPKVEWQFSQNGQSIHLEFSPDSQAIATWGSEIKIWVRDSGTFKLKTRLSSQMEKGEERSFCFSRDTKLIAASSPHRIKIWNCDTGQLIQSLPLMGRHRVLSIHVRPSTVSSYSIIVADGHNVEVWDLETCSCILKGHSQSSNQVASSTGTFIVWSYKGQLKIWDWWTGETLAICRSSTGVPLDFFPVSSIVRTTDGDWALPSEPGQLTQTFGFEPYRQWIQWKGHNLFKVPPYLRSGQIRVAVIPGESLGFTVAIESTERGLIMLRFSNEGGMLDDLISR
ncbi:unnamed protein product [Fusarium graminearum]|nr:unnamed protein product [Fusarium graminearum]